MVAPSGVIGPLDYKKSRMGQVFLSLANGSMPGCINGGFDFVDVRDVVAGAIAAEKKGRTGEIYLLTGHWIHMRDLMDKFSAIAGRKAPSMNTPMWLARAVAPFMLWLSRISPLPPLCTPESLVALRANKQLLHEKAEKELGYKPRPFDETARDIYEWFGTVGWLKPVSR